MPYLRFTQDDGTPAEVPIDAENSIVRVGRATDCHIMTRNSTVSRKHCQIVYTGTVFKLTDLKSSNGTFYNRERIEEQDLVLGDVFFCGNFEIHFVPTSMAEDAAPAAEPEAVGDVDISEYVAQIEALQAENAALQAQLADIAGDPSPELAAQVEALQADNAQLQSTLAEYQASLEAHQASLAEYQASLEAHQQALEAAQAGGDPSQLTSELEAANQTVADLQAQLAAQTAEGDSAELEASLAQIAELNQAIEQWQAHSAELEALRAQEAESYAAQVAELDTQIQAAGDTSSSEQLKQDLADANLEIQTLEEIRKQEKAALEAELDAARASNTSAADRAEIEQLRADLDAWRSDSEAARSELETARHAAEVTRIELEDVLADLEQARGQLAVHAQALPPSAQGAELEDALADLEQARGQLIMAQTEAEQLRGDLALAQTEAEQLRGDLALAQTEAEQARGDLALAQTELEQARGDLALAQTELEQCRSDLERLEVALVDEKVRAEEAQTTAGGLEALSEERRALESECDVLRARVDELQAVVDGLNDKLLDAEDALETERKAVAGLKADFDTFDATLVQVEGERDTFKGRVTQLENELAESVTHEEFERVSDALAAMKKEAADLEVDLEGTQARAKALEQQLEELRGLETELTAIRAELEGARSDADVWAGRVDALESDKQRLEQDLGLKVAELETLAMSSSDSSVEVFELKAKVTTLNDVIEGAETRRQALEREIEELQAKLDATDVKAELEEQLSLAQQRSSELEHDVTRFKARIESLEGELAAATKHADEATAARDDVARLTSDIEQLRGELDVARGAEREVARLQLELDAATQASAKDGDSERLAELEALQRGLEKSLARAEERGVDLADENDRLMDRVKELEQTIQAGGAHEEELAAVKDNLERTSQKLDRMREQLDEERQKVKELESKQVAPSTGGDDPESLREELDLVYQDINAVTRDWRTSVETLGDLVGEVQTSAGAGAESTFDQIGEILTTMNDASSGMKQALKQMRSLLSGED